ARKSRFIPQYFLSGSGKNQCFFFLCIKNNPVRQRNRFEGQSGLIFYDPVLHNAYYVVSLKGGTNDCR
ncbi:hypothetical protein, partial [Clostridium sp. MCC353]|uniref:hypothetical protein n=1 Tax=Clostridium sp. MCC353 TaxID=2592646 RepID=UPI001C01795A